MNTPEIPQTDSIQELARFWDTHDLTEFEDQLEEVTEPVFELDGIVRIQLPPDELEAVRKIAKSQGVDHAELIQRWVREKVQAS